ncbi:MAG: CRISPR-associated endonuclease Cas1 [Desulfurococcales archaeon]|nr:CRISPR-associated endonuclease Cas1 [Desulfurococcales archaeon]
MRLIVVRRKAELSVRSRATLQIKMKDKTVERPLRDVEAVLIIGGHVRIKSTVPPVLAQHNIPLAVLAMDNIAILVNPVTTSYNNYRRLQYTLDKQHALDIALEYIKAKVNGLASIIKNATGKAPQLPSPPRKISDPGKYEEEIRKWEATASNTLWDHLVQLIDNEILETLRDKYGFRGRKPRHPDPFNKTLSIMYAVIYSLATKALIAAGLDPTYGFLHKTKYSTPLTFDYTEMFKPVAVQATIDLINSEGLPPIESDGELGREAVNKAIKQLYQYLELKHTKTGKTIYQYIIIKAYCLAKHLERKCSKNKLTITWDKKNYKQPRYNES